VQASSTLRGGGVSTGSYASLNLGTHVGDAPEAVAENRRRLAAALALPAAPCWLDQVHGARILDLDAAPEADGGTATAAAATREPGTSAASAAIAKLPADGAVTSRPGVVCAILTADCLPVLLA